MNHYVAKNGYDFDIMSLIVVSCSHFNVFTNYACTVFSSTIMYLSVYSYMANSFTKFLQKLFLYLNHHSLSDNHLSLAFTSQVWMQTRPKSSWASGLFQNSP